MPEKQDINKENVKKEIGSKGFNLLIQVVKHLESVCEDQEKYASFMYYLSDFGMKCADCHISKYGK